MHGGADDFAYCVCRICDLRSGHLLGDVTQPKNTVSLVWAGSQPLCISMGLTLSIS